MEQEILSPIPLLTPRGALTEEGWARRQYWQFSASDTKKALLKQADRYIITDPENGLTITVDMLILGLRRFFSIAFVDMKNGHIGRAEAEGISRGKDALLPDNPISDHEFSYFDEGITMAVVRRESKLQLLVTAPYMRLSCGDIGIKAHILLHDEKGESMNAAFCQKEERRHWIVCSAQGPMKAEGTLFVGHRRKELSTMSLGSYEWERSRWNDGTVFRSSWISGEAAGIPWALVIGDGSGSGRNMNAIIRNGRVHRIGSVMITPSDEGFHISGDGISIEMRACARREISAGGTLSTYHGRQCFGLCRGEISAEGLSPISFTEAIGLLETEVGRARRRLVLP